MQGTHWVGASNRAKHQRHCVARSCVVCGARHDRTILQLRTAETKSLLDAGMVRARQVARSHLVSCASSAQVRQRPASAVPRASVFSCWMQLDVLRTATKGFRKVRKRVSSYHVQSSGPGSGVPRMGSKASGRARTRGAERKEKIVYLQRDQWNISLIHSIHVDSEPLGLLL